MKNKMKKLSAAKLSLIIMAITFVSLATSCKKSNTNNNSTFSGTYYGTLVTGFYSEPDTVSITTGSTSSAVVMNSRTGRGSFYTINGTVSGTAINIASQQVYIGGSGATYTASGTGTLTNSTLVVQYVFITPGPVTTNLTFTGTKK